MIKTTRKKNTITRNKLVKSPTGAKSSKEITESGVPKYGANLVTGNAATGKKHIEEGTPGTDVHQAIVQPKLTEEKSQAIIIENLSAKLEQSNAQIDQFRHSLSHDLQEPLRKIEMFSNILQQDEKNLNLQK